MKKTKQNSSVKACKTTKVKSDCCKTKNSKMNFSKKNIPNNNCCK